MMLKGTIFQWKICERGTFSVGRRDEASRYKALSHSPSSRPGEQHAHLDLVSRVTIVAIKLNAFIR